MPQNGLGEPVADQTTVNFRIFVMDPTNAQSQNTWTAVGPAPLTGWGARRRSPGTTANPLSQDVLGLGPVTALAVDPSDPSGNTVYIGAANGGVWKTTNFLTTNPLGPTWIPLTDFGPTNAVNIGAIAVFPRNNDPSQSIIFAGTGDGDGLGATHSSAGVGFLRSMDGGATWQLLDSLNNFEADGVTPLPINGASPISGMTRDHVFVGTTFLQDHLRSHAYPRGGIHRLRGPERAGNGGLYRSIDTGRTWQLLKAGQATDVVLDPYSGPKDAFGNPNGNLQILYVAFGNDAANSGVWIEQRTTARRFTLLNGGTGLPSSRTPTPPSTHVRSPSTTTRPTPTAGQGADHPGQARPRPRDRPQRLIENQLYQGWLYALVATTGDALNGLYVTKDSGANWTKVVAHHRGGAGRQQRPSARRRTTRRQPALDVTGAQSNYDLVMAVDPTTPTSSTSAARGNDALIRVDITTMNDLYSFVLRQQRRRRRPGPHRHRPRRPEDPQDAPRTHPAGASPTSATRSRNPTLNLLRTRATRWAPAPTIYVTNTASFNNTGPNARWIPFDSFFNGLSTYPARSPRRDDLTDLQPRQQRQCAPVVTSLDPLTGRTRLIASTDSGVWTGGGPGRRPAPAEHRRCEQQQPGVHDQRRMPSRPAAGDVPIVTFSRNGNLQIAQLYYGAVQPSSLAAQVAGALFYAQSAGMPARRQRGTTPISAEPRLTRFVVQHVDHRQPDLGQRTRPERHEFDAGPARGRGHRPDGLGDALPVRVPLQRRRAAQLLPGQQRRPDQRPAVAGRPQPDPQWPNRRPAQHDADVPVRQLRRQPGQRRARS